LADPPITQTVREGNPIDAIKEAVRDAGQDLTIEQLRAAITEFGEWASVVTEKVNRELIQVSADNRSMINSRHGSFQKIDDSAGGLTVAERTVEENVEFLVCLGCDDVYLPKVANHPGLLHIWVDQSTTFHADLPDQVEQINTMTLSHAGGITLFNDGGENASFPQWYAVRGEA